MCLVAPVIVAVVVAVADVVVGVVVGIAPMISSAKKSKAKITKSCTFTMNMAIVCEKCVAEAQRVTMNIRRLKQEQYNLSSDTKHEYKTVM